MPINFFVIILIASKWVSADILDQKHSLHSMRLHRIKREEIPSLSHPLGRATSAPSDPLLTGIGTHYTYLWVGTPSQRISVIVDTGSYRTAFPCDPCSSCGNYLDYHESGPFIPSDSSTFTATNTRATQRYSEGDGWSGYKVYDQTFLGAETIDESPSASKLSIDMELYCQDEIDGLFVVQRADGIMGLGFKASSPILQLESTDSLDTNTFSLCLAREGGTLSLGETASHLWTAPMTYASMTTSKNGFYRVTIYDIRIRPQDGSSDGSIGEKRNAYGDNFIVDSGTTYTYLPTSIKDSFISQWEGVSGYIYDPDQPLGEWGKLGWLPSIELVLKGSDSADVIYTFEPDAYLDKSCIGSNNKCYAYLSVLFDNSQFILGANFLQDHDVLFDADQQELGFATAACEWTGPYDDPSPSPTTTPAPTITFAPTPSPHKKGANNSDAVNVAIAFSVLAIACVLGACFAGSRNAIRRFRKAQADERAARGSGVLAVNTNTYYYKFCRCLVACLDRWECCAPKHRFDVLKDEDFVSVEIPENFGEENVSASDETLDFSTVEPSDEKRAGSLQSMAKTSLAHANRMLKKGNKTGYERPGEGSEF